MVDKSQFLPSQTVGDMKFVAQQEPWTVYQFENGCVYRVRPVLVFAKDHGIFGVEHPLAGLPSYGMQMQQMAHMEWTQEVLDRCKEFRRKHNLPELTEGTF